MTCSATARSKTELKLGHLPIRPYLSRAIRRATYARPSAPRSAIQRRNIFRKPRLSSGSGVATLPWHGITGWFEAGEAVKYLPNRTDVGAMIPDYRGGISYAKGFGHLMNGSAWLLL